MERTAVLLFFVLVGFVLIVSLPSFQKDGVDVVGMMGGDATEQEGLETVMGLTGGSVGYNDLSSDIVDIPQDNKIPPGYYPVTYIDTAGNTVENKKMRKIPYGYRLTADGRNIQPLTNTALYSAIERDRNHMSTDTSTVRMQDAGQLPVNTLPSADVIAATESDQIYLYDSNGNLVTMDSTNMNPQGSPLYYAPNNMRFSNTSFVPSYEQSVFLSSLTGDFEPATYVDPTTLAAGFCSVYRGDPISLERECSRLSSTACGSVSCCVLLGGSKCVAGNAQGPTYRSNYTDSLLRDKDYYHYQGQCYGNCTPSMTASLNVPVA